jgi:hypothetical protein
VVFAAGCAKPAPTKDSPLGQTIGACTVLSVADASAVLGGEVKSTPGPEVTRPDGGSFVSNCGFSSDQARGINVILRQAADVSSLRAQFTDAYKNIESVYGVKPQLLQNLGDSAFWIGGSVNELNVIKGGRWLTILTFGLSQDDRLSLAQNAAAKILPNL